MKNGSILWSLRLAVPICFMMEGCVTSPPARQVYQDPLTSIRLQVDERAAEMHSHPARISPEELSKVLIGVRVIARKGVVESIVSGDPQANPAFSAAEVRALATPLSRALAEAKSNELVTFYRRYTDAGVGLAITSGGLFVQGAHLYFVLANDRTLPAEGMNQNMVYEIDPIDSPLLPISRTGFRVTFTPTLAVVSRDNRGSWPYIDEGRVIVIDLARMAQESMTTSPAISP